MIFAVKPEMSLEMIPNPEAHLVCAVAVCAFLMGSLIGLLGGLKLNTR